METSMPRDVAINTDLATYALGPKNRSIASMSGSSQLLMPANPDRRALTIQNCGANVLYVTWLAAVAAADASGVVEIAPGAAISASLLGEMVPKGAIYVIGTAGQPIYAEETYGYPQRT